MKSSVRFVLRRLAGAGAASLALAAAFPAVAQDLLQVYRDARGYDAQYAAARFALEAGREKLPQGRALILPTLNLTGSAASGAHQPFSRERSLRSSASTPMAPRSMPRKIQRASSPSSKRAK